MNHVATDPVKEIVVEYGFFICQFFLGIRFFLISPQVVLNMAEANLDGNGYWYPLKNHEDENDPLVPPTPNQSPHNSFRFKGQRGPGEPVEQGVITK